MIISASRRTDIPALYADWFFKRLEEQYVLVRNPMNPRQVSRVELNPQVVDCIVFWTKNAAPMLERLPLLASYPFYFLFTINGYESEIETNLPDKSGALPDTFIRLADKIGPERVIWRYNPLFLNQKYDHNWHVHTFEKLARRLHGHTEKCIMSFLDFYPKIKHSMQTLAIYESLPEQKYVLAVELAKIAFGFNMQVDMDKSYKDGLDLSTLGINPASCIDINLIERITGCAMKAKKDPNQPADCLCAESVEIGAYSTCANGCQYCYANSGIKVQPGQIGQYDVNSPLLCSRLTADDVVKERSMKSLKIPQTQLKLL